LILVLSIFSRDTTEVATAIPNTEAKIDSGRPSLFIECRRRQVMLEEQNIRHQAD
jgi:hypothetical protein